MWLYNTVGLPVVITAIIAVIALFFIFFYVSEEDFKTASHILVGMGILFHLTGFVDFSQAFRNPLNSLFWLLAYVAVGCAWTIFKWQLFVTEWAEVAKKTIESAKQYYVKEQERRRTPGDRLFGTQQTWQEYLYENHAKWVWDSPEVAKNVPLLMGWAVWWPVSLLLVLFTDVLGGFYKWLVSDLMGKTLQNMADKKSAQTKALLDDEPKLNLTDVPNEKNMEVILDKHSSHVSALPGVNAVGIGDGCFYVYLVEDSEEIRRNIPSVLEGYPVVVRYLGEIKAE